MNKIIGIDLGTTNSVVSIMEGGKAIVIPNSEGHRTTPSVVSFSKEGQGERKVGDPAKRKAIMHPKETIYSVKRLMGKSFDQVSEAIEHLPYKIEKGERNSPVVRIGQRQYTPQEISAMILQKLKVAAKDYLNGEPKKAVITVPAYFNDAERQATKEAGEIAVLDVVRIINEPTAAALAYGLDKKDKEATIIVYDLGGGTFDVTLLHMGEGVFEVKATHGDTRLGGDDFDQRIIRYLIEDFRKKEGIDLTKDPTAVQRLKEAAEKAKIELSNASSTDINLPFITASQEGPKHLHITLPRSKFEKLCDDLIKRTIIPCEEALRAAKCTKKDIDDVILVGGSTRIPAIQQQVAEFFGKEPSKNVNPDEVVAMGAAIQGGILAGDLDDVVLLDVTPLSLGIETMGGVMTKLIDANTTIPTKKSQVFSTAENNQARVDVHVLQGERPLAGDNRTLGRFILDGIPPAPRGVPQIEVTFDIDANGIVSVSAKEKSTNKEQNIRIESSSNLSQEEIDKMKADATKHAEADEKEKKKIEKLNKANSLIFQVEKQLKDDKENRISKTHREQLTSQVADLNKAYEAKDMEKIEEHMATLEKTYQAAAMEMYSKATSTQKPKEESNKEPKVEEAEYEEVKQDKK